MSSKIGSHTGYLLIDHSNSPGIPDDLAQKWAKMGAINVPANTKFEADTWLCSHCQKVVVKNPKRTRPREVCRKCMRICCDSCVLWCKPFEQIIEDALSNKLRVSDLGLILPV